MKKKLTGKQKSQLESIRFKFGLAIPRKIADSSWMKHLLKCDLDQFECERYDEFLDKEGEHFLNWVNTDKNENILYIYLASKQLGIELVEVVDD